MPLFADSPGERSLERMMTSIPNFRPRGYGTYVFGRKELAAEDCDCRLCLYYRKKKKGCTLKRCPCIEERIYAGAASRKEILAELAAVINVPAFQRRITECMKESEDKPMDYRNEKHRSVFTEAIRKLNKKDYALMSAVYLLTAEHTLWRTVKRSIGDNTVRFHEIKLQNSTENGYTLFCSAKDLYVYFEEQGIHSTDPGAEFYITIYGSIAQSESENISANVKWGKAQSARDGKVSFHYKNFLGYRKGEDGQPEIDPEQAAIVRLIYEKFLAGDSYSAIAKYLMDSGIPTPAGKEKWCETTIRSILSNERYKGDAVINKTFITDCLTKKIQINNGERPKYYVENNHPAIIDAATFSRAQEERARRSGKRKVKQVGTKTEQGKYCGKYALTELLLCGECGTPYRRCTWTLTPLVVNFFKKRQRCPLPL